MACSSASEEIATAYRCKKCKTIPDLAVVHDMIICDQEQLSDLLQDENIPDPFLFVQPYLTGVGLQVPVTCKICEEITMYNVRVDAAPAWEDRPEDRDPRVDYYIIDEAVIEHPYKPLPGGLDSMMHGGDPTASVFYEDVEFDIGENILCQPFPLKLDIVAKTKMNRGYCYMSVESHEDRFYRPIFRCKPHACCWSSESNFEVGESYDFTALRHPDANTRRPTPYPHSSEDLVVERKAFTAGQFEMSTLYYRLLANSTIDMKEVFAPGILHDRKYIHENDVCPSVGLLKCTLGNLTRKTPENKMPRLVIDLQGQGIYDFPMTGLGNLEVLDGDKDRNVLVLLGLGRSWGGYKKEYSPERCYVLALNIFPA